MMRCSNPSPPIYSTSAPVAASKYAITLSNRALSTPPHGTVDLQLLAGHICGFQRLITVPVEPCVFTRREFQILRNRAARKQRKDSGPCDQSGCHDILPCRGTFRAFGLGDQNQIQTALGVSPMLSRLCKSTKDCRGLHQRPRQSRDTMPGRFWIISNGHWAMKNALGWCMSISKPCGAPRKRLITRSAAPSRGDLLKGPT